MSPLRVSAGFALLLGLAGALGGCRNSVDADRRVALRCEQIGRTADAVKDNECGRLDALARTANAVHEAEHRHMAAAADDLDETQAYWRRDWERWIKRQPLYRDEAWRILRGKPDRIERNAIMLFF